MTLAARRIATLTVAIAAIWCSRARSAEPFLVTSIERFTVTVIESRPVEATPHAVTPSVSGTPAQSRRAETHQQVRFGPAWVENSTGRTSVEHLIREHGYTREQLAPYANDQAALNRIHGAAHTSAVEKRTPQCPSGICPSWVIRRR